MFDYIIDSGFIDCNTENSDNLFEGKYVYYMILNYNTDPYLKYKYELQKNTDNTVPHKEKPYKLLLCGENKYSCSRLFSTVEETKKIVSALKAQTDIDQLNLVLSKK